MKKLSILLLTATALGSCKKEDVSSKADLLTAHGWKLTAQNVSITTAGTTTTNSTVVACNADDVYNFKTDKTLLVDAGALKCTSSDPQQQTGTWAFSNNEQNLTLNSPTLPIPGDFQIKELSGSTLHLYATQSFVGNTYSADLTFTKL